MKIQTSPHPPASSNTPSGGGTPTNATMTTTTASTINMSSQPAPAVWWPYVVVITIQKDIIEIALIFFKFNALF